MKNNAPNILWICSDQQRWDTLGCYGNRFVETPHIDALARTGTRCENAFVQNPLCTPSRASFLTGRYPRTTGCFQNGHTIPESEILVTKRLADAGYTCGLSGKLHLSPCHPDVCPGVEPRIEDGYSEFYWSHHSHPDMPENNAYGNWLKSKGLDYRSEPHPDCEFVKRGMPSEVHQTTWCADQARNFMRAHAEDDSPWLFSVNMFDPHSAFDPPAELLERYEKKLDNIPLPNRKEGELENKPPYQKLDASGSHGGNMPLSGATMDDKGHRLIRAAYWAMCDLIDRQVGRMMETLKETDQLENTLVIYMSDHGEMLGDHDIYLKGPYFYEELVHVPLILSLPGEVKAQTAPALVELVDLAPTLLEAAGLPVDPGMQGESLWPLLTGEKSPDSHRDSIYSEFYDAMSCHTNPVPRLTMVREATRKLVVDHTHSRGELYDLVEDPHEFVNLWDHPAAAASKSELLLTCCNRMANTVDPRFKRNAPW